MQSDLVETVSILSNKGAMNQMSHNTLIIKPGTMGDLLHLTPTIMGLRKRSPQTRIDILLGNTSSIGL